MAEPLCHFEIIFTLGYYTISVLSFHSAILHKIRATFLVKKSTSVPLPSRCFSDMIPDEINFIPFELFAARGLPRLWTQSGPSGSCETLRPVIHVK
jgi:hypothetical protein